MLLRILKSEIFTFQNLHTSQRLLRFGSHQRLPLLTTTLRTNPVNLMKVSSTIRKTKPKVESRGKLLYLATMKILMKVSTRLMKAMMNLVKLSPTRTINLFRSPRRV